MSAGIDDGSSTVELGWYRLGGGSVVDSASSWLDHQRRQQQPQQVDELDAEGGGGSVKPDDGGSGYRGRSRLHKLGRRQSQSAPVEQLQRRKSQKKNAALRSMRVSRFLGPSSTSTLPLKRSDQVNVYIRVVFLKVGDIDTVKETFTADIFVQARWREPLLDGQTHLQPDEIVWSKIWNPQLYVDNSLSEPKETLWRTVMWKNKKEAYIFERRRLSGTFIECLELAQFPFDTQDITLTLVSERSVRELTLEEDDIEISTVNVQSFIDEQEWKLYSNVETRPETVNKIYQDDQSTHPSFSSLCHVSRRFGFYVWNIFFVMFFICSMTFTTFAVVISKPENRLQLTFILLLTTITFKFAVNQSLPRISYLTYLDKYILCSMTFMCTICVWHAITWVINNDLVDKCVLAAFGGVYIIANVTFFIFIYCSAIRSRNLFANRERKHQEKKLEVRLKNGMQHRQQMQMQSDY